MPEIKYLLKWAEDKQHDTITVEETRALQDRFMMESNPEHLSHHLWRYLNLNLTGDAKMILQNSELSNGLDVWRKLMLEIVSRCAARRKALREVVWNPRPIPSLATVKMSIEKWEGQIKEFKDAGGDPPKDDMRVELLIGILPDGLQEHILWREAEFTSYSQLREFVHKKVEHLLRLKSRGKPISLAELGDDANMDEVLKVLPEGASDEAILAAIRGRQWPPRPGNVRTPPGRQGPPPRDRGDLSCANCGGKGHLASECKKARLEKHQRPCFQCGRPGHLARDCAERAAKCLEAEDADDRYVLCLAADYSGYRQPPKRKTARPQREPVTLADYITPTLFAKMNDPNVTGVEVGVIDLDDDGDANSTWECTDQERKDPRDEPIMIKCTNEYGEIGMLEVVWPDEASGIELNTAEEEEPEFIEIDLTWDTGAGASVLRSKDAPGHDVRESRGSRAGACFVGAGGDRMANQGQVSLEMVPQESAAEINTNFQVTDVTRPLWAMGEACDGDLEVLFTKTYAVMRDPRRGNKVLARAERKGPGGLYRSKMRVRNPKYRGPRTGPKAPSLPKVFGRQGARR